jgi:hypothetical protein
MTSLKSVFVFIAIACFYQASISLAFTMTSCQKTAGVALMTSKRHAHHHHHHHGRPLHVLNAEEDDENEERLSLPSQPISPPVVRSNSPPPVRNVERMDPLMASLTRDNRDPAQVTRDIPLFGEVSTDGLKLLIPATIFAVLGFILSIVVAVKSTDQIAGTFSTVADSVVQSAKNQPNQVYDANTCRGLCSNQQDDIDGLRRFMESITKKN